MSIPLTVLVVTIDGEDKLARILPGLRAVANDLVVGVDDSTTDASLEVARQYADTVFSVPHASFIPDGSDYFLGPLEISMRHCRGDWILRVDHDETLSAGWNDWARVQELLADRFATHYQILRRWATPGGEQFISSEHWYPDYQIRLFRNLPSIVRGPKGVHQDIVVLGEARWLVHEWIVHWDLVWHCRETREAKVRMCEQLGPFSGVKYYLFEGQSYETRPLHYVPPRAPQPSVPISLTDNPLGCWIEALEVPATMVTGVKYHMLIHVWNRSLRTFYPGTRGLRDANVLLSYHWLDASGATVEPWDHARMELPARLEPGQSATMFLPVTSVPRPGAYQLAFDLVEESVAWASSRLKLPVYPIEVVAAPPKLS